MVLTGKTDGVPAGTRPGGATDAVHVILGILRQVIVNDMAHAGNMQATCGNIGRYEYLPLALLKGIEQLFAFLLWNVTR